MREVAALISVGLLAAACSSSPGQVAPSFVQGSVVDTQPGRIAGLAWPSAETLVFEIDDEPADVSNAAEIWRVQLDGTSRSQVLLPQLTDCRRTRYHNPIALGGGSVGIVQACDLQSPGREPTSYALLALDPDLGDTKPLVSSDPLGFLDSFAAPVAAPNAERDAALLAVGDQVCSTIAFVDKDGAHPLDLSIGHGTESWNLSQFFVDDSRTCVEQGRAAWPTWSRSNGLIAFLASPQSLGVGGLARMELPWNIYRWSLTQDRAQTLLENVRFPRDLTWSPDGEWLAFGGEIGGRDGLWLLNPATSAVVEVTDDAVLALAWSPDGQSIAASVATTSDEVTGPRELVTYSVASLLEG